MGDWHIEGVQGMCGGKKISSLMDFKVTPGWTKGLKAECWQQHSQILTIDYTSSYDIIEVLKYASAAT
jgi:hypothetical protein